MAKQISRHKAAQHALRRHGRAMHFGARYYGFREPEIRVPDGDVAMSPINPNFMALGVAALAAAMMARSGRRRT